MKKTITLLFLFILILIKSNAQIALNPSIFKPDSAIYYADSVENIRYMLMTNKFDGDSINVSVYWYDSDTINYATKKVYYMDKDLPSLPFAPVFSGGGIQGSIGGYSFVYTCTIGDTLSKSYNYDFNLNNWVKSSKTKHNFSEEGIDTVVTTHMWNESINNWELNNITKQQYINSTTDTLKVLMLAPNLSDTILYDVLSYEYNSESKKSKVKRQTPGSLYIEIDSIIYNELGLLDYKYMGDNYECVNSQLPDCNEQFQYDYAYQYFFDTDNRLDKIYFWNKQGGLPDWEFDGCFKYYYPTQTTNTKKIEIEDSYRLYPNPCSDILKIEEFTGKIEVYNTLGQLMITKQMKNGGILTTSFLPKGIYIIKLGDSYSRIISKE